MNFAPLMRRLLLGALVLTTPVAAHEGHDHGDAPALAAPPVKAARLADGSVSLPFAGQAGLVVAPPIASGAKTLPARVEPDPAYASQVRASGSGQLIEPAGGFPTPGQRVAKGALLGWLKPAFDRAERSDLIADLARIDKDLNLAQQKLQQFSLGLTSGSVMNTSPQFLQLKADVVAVKSRQQEYREGLTRRIALRAPIAGVVGRSEMSVGRTVSAGDSLGELLDPKKLWLTAQNPDLDTPPPKRAYAYTAARVRVAAELIGESRRLVGQAVPLQYRLIDPPAGLAVGQPMTLVFDAARAAPPASALVQADGKPQVWVRLAAERFALKPVAELAPGDAVVVVPNARLRAFNPR